MSSIASAPTSATPAPDFSTPQPAGGPTTRSELAKAHHVARPKNAPVDWEISPEAILEATPSGHMPTPTEGAWYGAIKDDAVIARFYANRRAKTLRLVRAIVNLVRRSTMTLCITRQELMEATGLSKSFIDRTFAMLRARGHLAVIASGRSAQCAPKGQEQRPLAPVYLLLTLLPEPIQGRPVDESDTPSRVKTFRSYSQKKNRRPWHLLNWAERNQRRFAAAAQDPKTTIWPKHSPTPDKDQISKTEAAQIATAQALRLQQDCLDLRKLARKHIITETKAFFDAGWTPADVLHALEYTPDHVLHETNGAGGMRSIQSWLRIRLAAWMTNGTPLPSRDATRKAEAEKARAKARAEHEAVMRERNRPRPARGPGFRAYKQAQLIRKAGSEAAARHQYPEFFTTQG